MSKDKKRWWYSWEEPRTSEDDYRPNGQWPTPPEVIAYWCSGESETHFMMVAVVDAESPHAVHAAIQKSWPKMGSQRFCEPKSADFRPNDRFPWPAHAKEQ